MKCPAFATLSPLPGLARSQEELLLWEKGKQEAPSSLYYCHRHLQSLLQENPAILTSPEPSLGSCLKFIQLHCYRGGSHLTHSLATCDPCYYSMAPFETTATARVHCVLGASSHCLFPSLRLYYHSTMFMQGAAAPQPWVLTGWTQ